MEGNATFEEIGYILNAGVVGVAGTVDVGRERYIYEQRDGNTAQKTPYTYSIEAGDNAGAEEMSYCFVTHFIHIGKHERSGQGERRLGSGVKWRLPHYGTCELPATPESILANRQPWLWTWLAARLARRPDRDGAEF